MKRTREEHAARFDEMAAGYDEERTESEEYRACASLVIEHSSGRAGIVRKSTGGDRSRGLTDEDVVLDLGCGTGAIGLALAPDVNWVLGRDISEGMLERAREKATDRGLTNVEFAHGSFLEPNYDGPVDVVVSNFAMHHLSDADKREAVRVIADLGPRRFVLGDVMLFGEPDPGEPFYDPEVDDPATVGVLADALTDAGFALTAVEMVHEQVGVLVAEQTSGPTGPPASEPVPVSEPATEKTTYVSRERSELSEQSERNEQSERET